MDFGMFPMPLRHLLLNVGFFVVSAVLFVVFLILCILVVTFRVYLFCSGFVWCVVKDSERKVRKMCTSII